MWQKFSRIVKILKIICLKLFKILMSENIKIESEDFKSLLILLKALD